jgi:hypothetical protein
MTNFIMSLSTDSGQKHPVELSESPFCHYTYSNLAKVLKYSEISDTKFLNFISDYLPEPSKLANGTPYRVLYHDLTKLVKKDSPCLEGRGYLVESNPVAGNLSLTAGYNVSVLHVGGDSNHSAPALMLKLLNVEDDKNEEILKQIDFVLQHEAMPFSTGLTLIAADAGYGKAKFASPLFAHKNLVGIIRMRSGVKVWSIYAGEKSKTGAPKIYAEKSYLNSQTVTKLFKGQKEPTVQKSICETPFDSECQYDSIMKNGRAVTVRILRWNNKMIRGGKETNMKDKPIDIVQVLVYDVKTKKLVFDRDMFLAVTGKRKAELNNKEVQESYRSRFDVEKKYRFCNNNLMMNKLQSPDVEHQKKWLRIVQLSYWLLCVGAKEIKTVGCKVWQKYLPENKNKGKDVVENNIVSVSQAQKSLAGVFYTFGIEAFLPQKCKKGKGREKGMTFTPRQRYPIVKKTKKTSKKEPQQQNI